MTIHILPDRRLPFSGSPLPAVPLLPRSGFVQSAGMSPGEFRHMALSMPRAVEVFEHGGHCLIGTGLKRPECAPVGGVVCPARSTKGKLGDAIRQLRVVAPCMPPEIAITVPEGFA